MMGKKSVKFAFGVCAGVQAAHVTHMSLPTCGGVRTSSDGDAHHLTDSCGFSCLFLCLCSRMLGWQMCLGFTWLLGTQSQAIGFIRQTLYPRSRLSSS